jgi:hypothetical protein
MTLVAPGQSPAYISLAMLNLKIYDPSKVNIVILPMSSLTFDVEDPYKIQDWFVPYLTMMVERDVAQQIRPQIAIMDDVESGASLNAIRVFLDFVVKPWGIAKYEEKLEKAAANETFAQYITKCLKDELPGRGGDVDVEQKFDFDKFYQSIPNKFQSSEQNACAV